LAGAPLDVRRWAVVAVLTFVLGQADRLFQHPTQPMGTLLLAPGCVLACLLWWGTRYWTAAACGATAALFLMPGLYRVAAQSPWIAIPAIAAGFAAELWLMVRLLRWWRFRPDLSRGTDVLWLATAALVSAAIPGMVAMPIVYWPESLSPLKFAQACGTWRLRRRVWPRRKAHRATPRITRPWRRWESSPRDAPASALSCGGRSLSFRIR
jgi:hypothetical protein